MTGGKIFAAIIAGVLSLGCASTAAIGASVEETLAAINKLPAKERQRRLEDRLRHRLGPGQ